MSCREVEQLLTEDVELAVQDATLQRHLDGCSTCSQLYRELLEIEELKDCLARQSGAPRGLSQRVVQQYVERRQRGMMARAAVGLCVLIAGSGVALLRPGSAEVQQIMTKRPSVDTSAQLPGQGGIEMDLVRPANSGKYREMVLRDSAGNPFIVRVPSVIEIREKAPQRDILVQVSH